MYLQYNRGFFLNMYCREHFLSLSLYLSLSLSSLKCTITMKTSIQSRSALSYVCTTCVNVQKSKSQEPAQYWSNVKLRGIICSPITCLLSVYHCIRRKYLFTPWIVRDLNLCLRQRCRLYFIFFSLFKLTSIYRTLLVIRMYESLQIGVECTIYTQLHVS